MSHLKVRTEPASVLQRSAASSSTISLYSSFRRSNQTNRARQSLKCTLFLRRERPDRSTATTELNPTQDSQDHSSGQLPGLANKLLLNAASLLRPERKTAHCISCHGMGYTECTACKGAGILAPEKVGNMNTVKHAINKFRSLLGGHSTSMFDQDWVKSNRCRRCHGTGRLICAACGGTGRRP